jgi:hypothetical protein
MVILPLSFHPVGVSLSVYIFTMMMVNSVFDWSLNKNGKMV